MTEWMILGYLASTAVMFGLFMALFDAYDQFFEVFLCALIWPATLALLAIVVAALGLGWVGFKAGEGIKKVLS